MLNKSILAIFPRNNDFGRDEAQTCKFSFLKREVAK